MSAQPEIDACLAAAARYDAETEWEWDGAEEFVIGGSDNGALWRISPSGYVIRESGSYSQEIDFQHLDELPNLMRSLDAAQDALNATFSTLREAGQ